MNPALLSSDKMDWQTPDNVLHLVRLVSFTGQIGVDPCTTPDNPCDAVRYCWPSSDDGLASSWGGGGLVYCNPPYGRELPVWAAKMAAEARDGAEIIGLVPARPDTRWWHQHLVTANLICFWRGRLKFKGAPSAAPFPSALPYWGPRPQRFREIFGPHGWVVIGGQDE